jgi:CHASE2 domain-containing sensor protein/class 3 adenylate cyclase
LFTDMVDSVAMERRLGTEAYSRLLMRHHQLFRDALARVDGGKIHLDTGDGFFAEFTTAAGAVNAALLFQMLIRENKWESEAPKVRVGLHLGQFAEIRPDPMSPGKIIGIPVSMASRVMGLAQGGQILMTRQVYDDARQFIREHPRGSSGRAPPELRWEPHGAYFFKGSDQATEIFEVGAAGFAPLTAPPQTDKARSAASADRAEGGGPARRPLVGGLLAALLGLALWSLPFGEPWVNTSYDYLFRFSSRVPANPTNKLALILLDNAACEALKQSRTNWDRGLHAELLDKLTEARSSLVVFDINFLKPRNEQADSALAAAMKRHGKVVLMDALDDSMRFPGVDISEKILLPNKIFLDSAAAHGIGGAAAEELGIVRFHWPFPYRADEQVHSLPWAAARLAGANLEGVSRQPWLRYYGERAAWETFSYHMALSNAVTHFRDRIVFIGNDPQYGSHVEPEKDKFCTPYTRWTNEPVGGVKILATTFLNLLNRDWLLRPHWIIEGLLFVLTGLLAGGGLCFLNRTLAIALALPLFIAVTFAGVSLSYYTRYWFPWLIVAGAQIPCGLVWACLTARAGVGSPATFASQKPDQQAVEPMLSPAAAMQISGNIKAQATAECEFPKSTREIIAPLKPFLGAPETPDYELFNPPFGEGAFGKVWLVRNAIGQWQALKAVYEAKFGANPRPYETEFKGIQRYKPVSDKHPGLLRVDFVSKKKREGYFYYVMELGDAMGGGWDKNPRLYKPRDLATVRAMAPGRRLPLQECVRIGLALSEALEFLHQQGLTHRDIKPQNIIFVNGHPKLADVGLVAEIRPTDEERTNVGTPGYMPPPPELPGSPQADVYGLGMVLFVVSSGRDPVFFQEVSAALRESGNDQACEGLNKVILKACQPDRNLRYAAAAEMRTELLNIDPGPHQNKKAEQR